ncbi:MAG: GumC family protein [Alphaproteobacteria bacterium]
MTAIRRTTEDITSNIVEISNRSMPTIGSMMGDRFDVKETTKILWRHKLPILAVMMACFFASIIFVTQVSPVFQGYATVLINERKSSVVNLEAVLSGLDNTSQTVRSEIEVIRSRYVIGKVVDQLKLLEQKEYNPYLVSSGMLDRRNMPSFIASLLPKKDIETLPSEQRQTVIRERVIDEVLKQLSVQALRETLVIEIRFDSKSKSLAYQVPNAIVNEYLNQQLEVRFSATERATKWLSERLGGLKDEMQKSERAVENYRKQTGLIQGSEGTLKVQEMTELNTKLIEAKANARTAEARLSQAVRARDDNQTMNDVLQSSLIQKLREQEAELLRRSADLSTRYGAKHPTLLNLQAELQDLQGNIKREINKIISGLRNEVEVARTREYALESNMKQLQDKAATLNTASVELKSLESDAQANRALYENFLNRFKETSNQQDLQQADARGLSAAVLTTVPIFPKPLVIIPISLCLGIALGISLAFILEAMDRAFRSGEQVEQVLGVASVGLIPELNRGQNPVVHVVDKPISAYAESIRSVRTALLVSNVDQPPKVVLITSSTPREGKSSFSLSFARVAAMSGQRVILIDCDLRRPTMHKNLGVENNQGMVELLSQHRPFEEFLHVDALSGLHYITAGQSVPNPLDLLSSQSMRQLLRQLRDKYDLVLVDSPPVLAVSDPRVLATMADKTLFMCRWGETPRQVAKNGVKQMIESGANMAGVVLTRVNLKKHHTYSYGDSGYYGGYYKKYYTN